MLLKLNSLNESLEKKYKLDEAFDESMPKWLKDAIALSAVNADLSSFYEPNANGSKDSHSGPHKLRTWTPKKFDAQNAAGNLVPQYQTRRDWYSSSNFESTQKEFGLAGTLLAKGIDLSKVKVYSAPNPHAIVRASKKRPQIDIYHFDNGQVWARGFNDREICNFTGLPFYASSKETMGEHLEDYAYIELNDPNIDTVSDIRDKRRELKNELMKIPNYYRNPGKSEWVYYTSLDNVRRSKQVPADKSGYFSPLVEKTIAAIEEAKRAEIINIVPSEVEQLVETISDLKDQLAGAILDVDISLHETDNFDIVEVAINFLKLASKTFDNACASIARMANASTRRDKIRCAESAEKLYKEALEYVEEAKIRAEKLITVSLDW